MKAVNMMDRAWILLPELYVMWMNWASSYKPSSLTTVQTYSAFLMDANVGADNLTEMKTNVSASENVNYDYF